MEKSSSILTKQISLGPHNLLFHSNWDNFNQRLSGVHGKPICSTTGGIMIQEVSTEAENPHVPPSASMSDNFLVTTSISDTLPDFFAIKTGPIMKIQLTEEPIEYIPAYNSTSYGLFVEKFAAQGIVCY